jgi:hypothetical protein
MLSDQILKFIENDSSSTTVPPRSSLHELALFLLYSSRVSATDLLVEVDPAQVRSSINSGSYFTSRRILVLEKGHSLVVTALATAYCTSIGGIRSDFQDRGLKLGCEIFPRSPGGRTPCKGSLSTAT